MMLKIIVILAHLSVISMGSDRVGYPGYEHFPEVKGWLKLHVEPTTWKAARTNCHNEGALLASPWLPEFESAVRKLLSTRFHTISKVYSGAGLRKDSSAGIPLEPCANKRCRAFLAAGGMDKVRCDDQLPYVCYAPEASCPDGYVFKSEMGECYKYHSDASTLPNAAEICRTEGGFLAYISNSVEQKILHSFVLFGFVYIDGGGSDYRHLHSSYYEDKHCLLPHHFICELVPQAMGSDFID